MALVVVTGAAGFIAGEIIHQLLEKGYQVRGTVRSVEKHAELAQVFPGLQLFEADLLKEGSFDEAFKGVQYVFHTASPFLYAFDDPQKDLVDPALLGTKNVLSAVEKNLDTIKRVVVTSSVAAVVHQSPGPETVNKIWDESDWNSTSTLTEGPYRLSKYLAEQAAWAWAKEHEGKVELLTVNPSFVLGKPRYKRTDSVSIVSVISLLNGKVKATGANPACFGVCDIRNVAQAHIACIEKEKVSGRHLITSTKGYTQLEYANILRPHFPQYPLPETQNGEVTYCPLMSQEKAKKELGIEFYSVEDTLLYAANGILELGLAPTL